MANPPFVVPAGVMQIPPNYAYRQVGQRGFPLKASYGVLKKLVDRCLNDNLQGTGISYTPIPTLTDYTAVYLLVSTYGSMVSKLPPFSGLGWMSQSEAIFTIPLLSYRRGIPLGLACFTPYSFVDNSWSIITGNLLMGFQKGLASFQIPSKVSEPYPMEISTPVFPVFNPATPLSWERWISIGKQGDTDAGPEPRRLWPIGPVEELFGPRGELAVSSEVLDLLRIKVRTDTFDAVQLLQLRDPAAPDFAAYSKVVAFAMRLKNTWDGGLLAGAEIELQRFDSLPVRETLGLVPEQGPLVSLKPYWIVCDFDFDLSDPGPRA
jgi:hypothetical protein